MDNIVSDQEQSLAVITGASSGIGFELAKVFAQEGYDLIICSNSYKIFEAQERLEQLTGAHIQAIEVDLSSYDGVEILYDVIKGDGRPVEAIAINAGVGLGGPFDETDLREELRLIRLNVDQVVHLTKLILPDLYEQKRGRILYTSSLTAELPAPFEAVYGGSKAFVSSFADAIREEAKDHGVTVTALMPGPTNTNFFHRAHMDDTSVGSEGKEENDPSEVARQGFDAMMKGEAFVVAASLKTKVQGMVAKVLPDSIKSKIHRGMSEPGSAKH